MEDSLSDPFADLLVSSPDFLEEVTERSICEICLRSRKYFCYSCHVPMAVIKNKVPQVKIPLQIDIIKYPKEVDGKSTATHAVILAPQEVSMYNYPNFPDIKDKEKVLIVFPGKQSITLEELHVKLSEKNGTSVQECSSSNRHEAVTSKTDEAEETAAVQLSKHLSASEPIEDKRILAQNFPFERIIFIDSTWNQVQKINNDDRLKGIQRVELKTRESRFWRYQRGKPRSYLCTIEAIYYFLVDVHRVFIGTPYNGEYDNLLFFFSFMYNKINVLYNKNLRVYTWQSTKKPRGKFNF